MGTISQAKVLGGLGSLFVLLTAAPTVGWALGIAGFIMTLYAVKYISDAVKDRSIFNNMLASIVSVIAAIAVGTIVVLGTFLRVLGMGLFAGPEFVPAPNITVGDWVGLAGGILVGLVAIAALLVVSGVFIRRSYNAISTRLKVGMFATAGLLYLIGAATAVIGVGFIILFVAQLLVAVSFFSISEPAPEAAHIQSVPVAV